MVGSKGEIVRPRSIAVRIGSNLPRRVLKKIFNRSGPRGVIPVTNTRGKLEKRNNLERSPGRDRFRLKHGCRKEQPLGVIGSTPGPFIDRNVIAQPKTKTVFNFFGERFSHFHCGLVFPLFYMRHFSRACRMIFLSLKNPFPPLPLSPDQIASFFAFFFTFSSSS